MISDEKLILLFEKRDESVLLRVSEAYGQYCRQVARNILPNVSDADDCASDAYMHAWYHIPPDKPKSLLAYLARITRNLALDIYRREHSKKRMSHTEVLLSEVEEMLPDTASSDPTDRIALTDALNAFLATLPTLARKVFVRRYFYADTVRAIAREYGVSEASVKVSLHRTRNSLKTYLKEKGIQV